MIATYSYIKKIEKVKEIVFTDYLEKENPKKK
jgi:hypothetical protein